jgi:hypothetical protein
MLRWMLPFIQVIVLITSSSCGYALRTSKDSPRFSEWGVRRVYIRPIQNETFRAGVENSVYTQTVRMISSTPGLRSVNSPEDADAEWVGTVRVAQRTVSGETKASDLNPKNLGSPLLLVASEYTASLACSFALTQKGKTLWSGDFQRARPFPANSQVGALGSTGALINESEFERALGEVAADMMVDVRSSLTQDF